MEKKPERDGLFLREISRIRREFQDSFNRGNWRQMEGLYWETAVLVLTTSKRVIRGRKEIVKFWQGFKRQKPGRRLFRIQPLTRRPILVPVELIEVISRGQYNIFDLTAHDFCAYRFNPDEIERRSVDVYFHRRTCSTALSSQEIAL